MFGHIVQRLRNDFHEETKSAVEHFQIVCGMILTSTGDKAGSLSWSYRLGNNTFVALAQTLVSTDLHILLLVLFHQRL